MKETENIAEVFNSLKKLPTLPGIAMRILEVVKREEDGLKEIAEILSTDPPLSAEVLKAINSPFYGLPTKVTSVPHAVNLLGIKTVKSLALSFSLVKNFQSKEANGFDYTLFWKESLIGAVATKLIAQKLKPAFAEDAFFLGLIHNIGKLALSQCMPEQYSLVLNEIKRSGCSYQEAEKRILGFSHAEFGEFLAKKWDLPESFSTPIRYHHEPNELHTQTSDIERITRALYMSSIFIDLTNSEDERFYMAVAQLEFAIKNYGFQDKLQIDEIANQIHKYTKEVFPLFDIKIENEKDYFELIENARKELINISQEFMQQVCEQNRLIQSLSEQSRRDSLTDLLNYQSFQESLEREIYRAKRYKHNFCLIFSDIDYFKNVNDSYGHLAGDHALRAVAKSLQDSLRNSDIIARYGGEEFAIILPETNKENGLIVAERLRETICSLSIDYDGHPISLSMSFGIAFLDSKDNITKIDLIKRADDALYQAKKTGRNRCCYFGDTKK